MKMAFVAFLRAINVGGRTVKMARLRELFSSLGYTQVRTFIASGNVIFESADKDEQRLETTIERMLAEALGFEVATFVRSMSSLVDIAERRCRDSALVSPEALYVGFLKATLTAGATRSMVALGTPMDVLRIDRRELYWLCRTKISDSKVSGAAIEKKLRAPMTMRNATTVRKIAALALPPSR